MNSDVETYLKNAMRAEAQTAPPAAGLATAARARLRHHRRATAILAAGTASIAAVVLGAALITNSGQSDNLSTSPSAAQPLPDSGWPESGIAAHMLLDGVLRATADGCFYLERTADVGPHGLLWPQGWTWTELPDGTFTVMNDRGEQVMKPGDYIRMGGGYTPDPQGERDICGVGTGPWFPMNEAPTKVPEAQ